jgi:hypothetical protein
LIFVSVAEYYTSVSKRSGPSVVGAHHLNSEIADARRGSWPTQGAVKLAAVNAAPQTRSTGFRFP